MRPPFVSSTDAFHPVWSGLADLDLRPTLEIVRDGSGFRPLDATDMGFHGGISGTVSVTGIVDVDAVGITGRNGVAADVIQDTNGNNSLAVVVSSGIVVTSGNISVTNNASNAPALPASYGVYAINLTGVGVFSNYATSIPNFTGNPVQLSVEPDSDNTDKVYYAFSGTASTGQAWELRGDKTFEIGSSTGIFFAQVTGSNRIMIHYQKY